MEIPRAAVIAQSLPEFEHFVFVGRSQGADVGKPRDEAQVIVHPLRDPRLLENDLREPDAIGVACPTPGQVASVDSVPVDQFVGDFAHRKTKVVKYSESCSPVSPFPFLPIDLSPALCGKFDRNPNILPVFDFVLDTPSRHNQADACFCARLFVSLTSSKILSFGNVQINLTLHSLIRIVG